MQRRTLFIAGLALAGASSAFAQASKPIRLIVPYAPGGPLDVTARALAERVEGKLGTIIVENKPGAGGNIGSDYVAKAAPDGQVIGLAAVAGLTVLIERRAHGHLETAPAPQRPRRTGAPPGADGGPPAHPPAPWPPSPSPSRNR